jgi:hypothetical protein
VQQFFVRLGGLDRRWIFLVVGLAVAIPLWLGVEAPMPTSPIVQRLFDRVETLPEGSVVLISYDYGPGTDPENQPMADALLRHCMERNLKVVLMALWPTGVPQINTSIESIFAGPNATHPAKIYGVDWLTIGYQAGNQGVINSLVTSFSFFPSDAREGRSLTSFAIMQNIRSLKDIDLILGIGSGKPGLKEWIQFGGDQADVPVGGGVTAVEAPQLYPYYPSQLLGLMGGLQGAAEYESALSKQYPRYVDLDGKHVRAATSKMGPQTVAHLMIVLFVVIGNVAMFMAKRGGARG